MCVEDDDRERPPDDASRPRCSGSSNDGVPCAFLRGHPPHNPTRASRAARHEDVDMAPVDEEVTEVRSHASLPSPVDPRRASTLRPRAPSHPSTLTLTRLRAPHLSPPLPLRPSPFSQEEYQDALRTLQSTISGKTRAAPKGPDDLTWEQQFERLRVYLDRLGMTSDVDALSVIHVAGTKGKGSTCAFVEHILRECGTRTGLYSSPHLVDVRERFRVDGVPVSKTTFVREFWWLFRGVREKCADLGVPAYFRFLTLLGFRIFSRAKVECLVLEVGLGGRLDATNLVRSPAACGVTSLGLDHVDVLGDTLAKIAREKAGIFKPRAPAFTSPQPEEAMAVLRERAAEIGAPLEVAPPLRAYANAGEGNVALGLAGAHQELNAALAVRLVREWAHAKRPAWGLKAEAALAAGTLPPAFRRGLAKTEWWGRAQTVPDAAPEGSADASPAVASNLTWYLDGAHTEESMRQCAEWFCASTSSGGESAAASPSPSPSSAPLRLLLFNCMEERDPKVLLAPLAQVLAERDAPLTHPALFAPSESSSKGLTPVTGAMENTAWQQKLARTWDDLARKHAGAVALGGEDGAAVGAAQGTSQGIDSSDAMNGSSGVGGGMETATGVASAAVMPCLRQAVERIRVVARERVNSGRRVHVLVAGSLYLVGDMLRLLGRAG